MNKDDMRIILLEFVDEAQAILSQQGASFLKEPDVVIICLDPAVRAFLKRQGVETQGTLDYFDNAAQHRIILKVEDILDRIKATIDFQDRHEISCAYQGTFNYYFRSYLSYVFWIIEVLKGIKSKHALSGLYACAAERRNTDEPLIQDDERFAGLLAKDFCRVHNIEFHAIPVKKTSQAMVEKIAGKLVAIIGRGLTFLELNLLLLNRKKEEKLVIIPGVSYRMGDLITSLRRSRSQVKTVILWQGQDTFRNHLFKIRFIMLNVLSRVQGKHTVETMIPLEYIGKIALQDDEIKHLQRQFERIDQFLAQDIKDLLMDEGVDVGAYVRAKTGYDLKVYMRGLLEAGVTLHDLLKKLRPDLLMAMYSVGIYDVMGDLSHQLGFASLNISHGTHVPPNNPYEEIENRRLAYSVILNSYKHVAVQTPWADKFLDHYGDRRPRIKSGPLLYSEVNLQVRAQKRKDILSGRADRKIILHATTQKTRQNLRFHIEESLDEYIDSLKDLVQAVNGREDTFLVIRPHPVCSLSEDDFRCLLPPCERLKVWIGGSFSDCLSTADVLVSYSSTCIEEATQNNITVLLYDKWHRYNHFNLPEITEAQPFKNDAAYYLTDPAKLSDTLVNILNLGQVRLDENLRRNYAYPPQAWTSWDRYIKETLA